jgi:hypothetical protein
MPLRARVAAGRRLRRIERDLTRSDPEFTRLFDGAPALARLRADRAPRRERARRALREGKRILAHLALSTLYSLDPVACAFRPPDA